MTLNFGWNTAFGLTLFVACVIGCKSGTSVNTTTTTADNSVNMQGPSNTATPPDIAGQYNVVGTNPNGSPYRGTVEVIRQGAVYQFRWKAGPQYDGVGVVNGNVIAVAFTEGADGKGCGVVDYTIAADGTLDGKWGYWGQNDSGTETAKRTSGSGLVGEYEANGTNPDGKQYKGHLSVASEGGGYKFTWSNGSEGFGIKQGENVAVGIGGRRCAFVSYQVKPDGTLEGIWGGYGSSQTGTEKATKR